MSEGINTVAIFQLYRDGFGNFPTLVSPEAMFELAPEFPRM